MKKRMLGCFVAFAVLLTMLVGCGSQKGTASGSTGGTSKPVKDSLTIAAYADMDTLDPMHSASSASYLIFANIYDDLVEVDKYGNIEPSLAESWTMSNDGLSYTFKLKKGVKFHNGEEFKASDVAFSINTAKKSPYMANQTAPIKDVVVIDDYNIKIDLNYPYAPFLKSLYQFYILNEKAAKAAGDSYGKENAVGTGPYKFVKHSVGQSVVLERYDEYFKGAAPIKNVEFKVMTDLNSTLVALTSGEVDFAYMLPTIAYQSVKNNPDIAMHEFDSASLTFVLMNNNVKPFNNVLVRQAISYAIDKDAVIQIAEEGKGRKTQSIFNKLTFGYSENVKGYEYNPEKAKEFLAKAGYPNGFKVTFKTLDGSLKKGAQVIQENLSKVGITANIEVCEQNAYISDMMSGNYEMGNVLFTAVIQDADYWEMIFNSKSQMNLAKYNNPKVDELFSKGKKLNNKNERLSIYEELAQTVNDDAVIEPLYYNISTYYGRKDLKVGYINAAGITKVAEMHWEK